MAGIRLEYLRGSYIVFGIIALGCLLHNTGHKLPFEYEFTIICGTGILVTLSVQVLLFALVRMPSVETNSHGIYVWTQLLGFWTRFSGNCFALGAIWGWLTESLYVTAFGITLIVYSFRYLMESKKYKSEEINSDPNSAALNEHIWREVASSFGIINGLAHLWYTFGCGWCIVKGFKDFSPKGSSPPKYRLLDYFLPNTDIRDN